jgi:hypothetical protein
MKMKIDAWRISRNPKQTRKKLTNHKKKKKKPE